MFDPCGRSSKDDYFIAITICLIVLILISFSLWSFGTYRHEIATIVAMRWVRSRSIQREVDVTSVGIDHEGNAYTYSSTEWRTIKTYRTRGGRHTILVWPKPRPLKYRERIVSSQYLDIHMNGKTEGKLDYTTSNYNEWNRYNIGQDVYLTLMWRKTVWEIKPYKMETK